MTCQAAIAVLADYLETMLSPHRVEQLEEHLRGCDECQAYLATYRKTRALAAQVNRVDMPAAMKRRLRAFLIEQLGSST